MTKLTIDTSEKKLIFIINGEADITMIQKRFRTGADGKKYTRFTKTNKLTKRSAKKIFKALKKDLYEAVDLGTPFILK